MRNKETEKLFKLAYTDAMTGVYNRNAYEEKLEKLNKVNARLDNIMVVIVDLDKLKCINDTYGHRTGDDAIKTVADCILKTVGKKADIYRIGGDEFVCIAERDISSYIAELRDLVSFTLPNIAIHIVAISCICICGYLHAKKQIEENKEV